MFKKGCSSFSFSVFGSRLKNHTGVGKFCTWSLRKISYTCLFYIFDIAHIAEACWSSFTIFTLSPSFDFSCCGNGKTTVKAAVCWKRHREGAFAKRNSTKKVFLHWNGFAFWHTSLSTSFLFQHTAVLLYFIFDLVTNWVNHLSSNFKPWSVLKLLWERLSTTKDCSESMSLDCQTQSQDRF